MRTEIVTEDIPVMFNYPDCRLEYHSEWIPCGADESLAEMLKKELEWQERKLFLFGRWVDQPRLTALYGDVGGEYSYTGSDWEAKRWHPALESLRDRIQQEFGWRASAALCNLYRGGSDSVAWHSDGGRSDGADATIFSLSLGATRTFQIRHNTEREHRLHSIRLESGSLLVMGAPMQRFWKHQVPKERASGHRINITFRALPGKDGSR